MIPFDEPGVWLRCALHAHTTNSDGELAPDMLVRHYEWAGYDVLAITDHWVRTDEPSTDGAARHPVGRAERARPRPVRTTPTSSRSASRPTRSCPSCEFAPLQEVVAWMLANGGVPYLAHTYWSGLRTEQWEACAGLLGIEVWNAGCELELGRGDSSLALGRGARARPAASTGSRPTTRTTPATTAASPGRGCAPRERTQEAVLDALRVGRVLRLDRAARSTRVEVDRRTTSPCAAARRRA